MSDPRRLKQEIRDPMARALLASAELDGPAPGARERAKLALALDAPAVGAPAVRSVRSLVSLGLIGAAVIAGSIALAPRGHAADPAELAGDAPVEVSDPLPELPPALDAPTSTTAPPDIAAPTDVHPRTSRAPVHATGARGASLLEQMALVEAARAALAARDPGRALGILDDLERRFPQGAFGEEATVLRIEAWQAAGEGDRAHALARRFLEEHPTSAYARRVRSEMR